MITLPVWFVVLLFLSNMFAMIGFIYLALSIRRNTQRTIILMDSYRNTIAAYESLVDYYYDLLPAQQLELFDLGAYNEA